MICFMEITRHPLHQSARPRRLIRSSRVFMIEASHTEPINPSALQGKRVVFTGTLTTMTRNEAKLLLCEVGGYPQNTLGPSTDYLVIGETNLAVVDHRTGTSSKFRKAQKQGIPILSETEFLNMVYL